MPSRTDDGAPGERPLASVSRRSFLKGAGAITATGAAVARAAEASAQEGTPVLEGWSEVELDVNGARVPVRVQPRTTLLSALRDHATPPLTGSKVVCDRGTCGACTVLVDGRPVYACMTLAVSAIGKRVRTVEGLAEGGELSPVQRAFCSEDALMCGFCTPGFLMSVTACLERNPGASDEEVRRACAGNLCRCGTQPHVFEAALEAGRELAGGGR